MKKSTAKSDDFNLKHRIVGAAILVFFLALIVPWVLSSLNAANSNLSERSSTEEIAVEDTKLDQDLVEAIRNERLAGTEQVYVSKITPLDQVEKNAAKKSDERNEPIKTAATKPIAKAVEKPVEKKPTKVIEAEPEPINVGWVVQVGLFTDMNGVARVIADLEGKGFKPSTTIVDTNKGVKGTRIWLGPYAQRVEAAKAKNILKQKTGEAGFIRVYP